MDPWWTLTIVLGLSGLALLAWSIRALDAPGAVAALTLGLLVGLLNGLGWLVLLSLFTVVSVIATRIGHATKTARKAAEGRGGERGLGNVVANGAAAAIAAVAVRVADPTAAALAFAAAIAAVTADTLASEIGALSRSARSIVPPFLPMRVGQNGGVSWAGQAAAAAGAVGIALAAVPLLGVPERLAWVPALAGFLGCQLDSVLGATLERDAERDRPLSKQDVNFLASVVPMAIVLLLAA